MSKIDSLKEVIVNYLDIPEDKVKYFNDKIDFTDYIDSSKWIYYNIFLTNEKSGSAKSFQIFFNFVKDTNKYNVFMTEVKP